MSNENQTDTAYEATASTAAAGSYPAEAASAPGLPQLDFTIFPHQIFWLTLALLAIYYLLSKIALPRISDVLSERRGTISNDLAMAEEFKKRAEEAEEKYEFALAEARKESAKIIAETKESIQNDLDAAIAEADVKISERTNESEREIALIQTQASQASKDIALEIAGEISAAFGVSAEASALNQALSLGERK